ncbi:hypothetical protein QTH91_11475 [Variovorax dokdonensis]|uniref:Lipoprotein n=1 Tax=Variovorax dokdonensis TaxID=344883 RepID=A0ABT7NAZ9_9BURK|nr:hypothetical protein [Variovorax dokdonensis]MDM0045104.1 hypothetical protein [Variovorax dokdonensis]
MQSRHGLFPKRVDLYKVGVQRQGFCYVARTMIKHKFVLALGLSSLLLGLGGCAATTPPPGGYGVCAEKPGSYECQIERYRIAG